MAPFINSESTISYTTYAIYRQEAYWDHAFVILAKECLNEFVRKKLRNFWALNGKQKLNSSLSNNKIVEF
jgi:hypothetical protein